MDAQLNREIKAYCPDFAPVRRTLREVGATFVEVKEQVDYYYHLPRQGDAAGTRRLKLRVEHQQGQVIYYCDRQENGARTSNFQLWEVNAAPVQEMLDAALGRRAVVRKRRELWRKGNVVFNLDVVADVGQVFEVEAPALAGHDADAADAAVAEYRRLFSPYLGQDIPGSNEDLVAVIS